MNQFLVLFFFIFLLNGIESAPRADTNLKLTVLHNNDMHGRFEQVNQRTGICQPDDAKANKCYGGFARIATV